MIDSPSVFIVILNYNGGKDLHFCLKSVFGIKYPRFSVVLVDNASSDGSFQKARLDFPQAFFVKNKKNLGFAAGNNVGIKFSLEKGAEYILLLNNDTVASSDLLAKLTETFLKNPCAGIVSPVIFDRIGKIWFSGGKIDWMRMKTRHIHKIKSKKPYFSEFITGCAMMARRRVFEKIGFLDEKFFLYYEDADFSLRSKKAGFENIIVPDAKIAHLEKSENDSEKKTYWLVLSGLLFFRKNSVWLFSLWHSLYLRIRKLKNRLDIGRRGNRIDLAVAEAYRYFKKHGR